MKSEFRDLNLSSIQDEHARGRAHNLGKTTVKISYQLGPDRVNYWLHRQAGMLALARDKRIEAEGLKEKAAALMAESKQLTNEAAKMASFLSADVVEGVWDLEGHLYGSVGIDRQWIEDSFGPVPESMMPLDPYRRDAIMAKISKGVQSELFPAASEGQGAAAASEGQGAGLEAGAGELDAPTGELEAGELDAPDHVLVSSSQKAPGLSSGSDDIPWGDSDPDHVLASSSQKAPGLSEDADNAPASSSSSGPAKGGKRRRIVATKRAGLEVVSGGDNGALYVG